MKHLLIPLFLIHTISTTATQFCVHPTTSVSETATLELAMNNPMSNSFGKTHFIVGCPTQHQEQGPVAYAAPYHASTHAYTASSIAPQAFFSPDDNIGEELIHYINQETEKIRIAIFMMTDSKIAKSLQGALQRNVIVELITDVGCLKERSNKINDLCERGCTVYIYNPSYDQKGRTSLMHHKFALFTNNQGRSLLWTGSYNFTKAASNTNQENAIVLDDQKIFDIFSQQFRKLKKRSNQYGQRRKGAHA